MTKAELYNKIAKLAGYNVIPAWEIWTIQELTNMYRYLKVVDYMKKYKMTLKDLAFIRKFKYKK